MDRRQYLAFAGGTLAGLAGCTDGPAAPGTDPGGGPTPTGSEATLTGTLTANGTPALDRLEGPFAQRAVGGFYLAVATEQRHAERLATALGGSERGSDAPAFLRDTDYGAASVVCVQEAQSSAVPDLDPVSTRVAGEVVTLAARYPGEVGTDDITTDLLLVRMAHPAVTHATVVITSQAGTTTRFSTVGRYGRERLAEPRPLVVRNRDCREHRVRITATVDGELVAAPARHESYQPAAVSRHRRFLTEAATHTVRAWTSARETPTETTVSPTADADDGVGVLLDIAGTGAVSIEARPIADLHDSTRTGCEASSLPYESADPSKNVADPARLQWLNESDTGRRVRLVVGDGDQSVIDRAVSMAAGGKGRTEGLLAKRGVYDTRLVPGAGEERRLDWAVDESGADLQVRVEADGSLTIATDSLAG